MESHTEPNDQQTEAVQNGKSAGASRLTVAGILALVGARLGAETTIVFNFVKDLATGKHQKTASSEGNILTKAGKMLFSSFNQKSTYIAAGIGAAVLGAFGWTRGDRIEHPIDLLKHPLNSFKVLFGRQQEEAQPVKTDASASPQAETPPASTANTKWQNKVMAEQQAVTPSGQSL